LRNYAEETLPFRIRLACILVLRRGTAWQANRSWVVLFLLLNVLPIGPQSVYGGFVNSKFTWEK
jgi:hypothetical protein